jgi:fucose permease
MHEPRRQNYAFVNLVGIFEIETMSMLRLGAYGFIALIFTAFISLGMPDGLLGVAWPSLRNEFSRPIDAMATLLVFGTAGYMLSSLLSGLCVDRFGVGWMLAGSCALTATGLAGFALLPAWFWVVPLSLALGLGAGAIDAGLNNYVEANYGHRLMQWLHASFGIGITLGPLLMTLGLSLTSTWRTGYAVVSIFQVLLAVTFAITANQWQKRKKSENQERQKSQLLQSKVVWRSTMANARSWWSAALFFIYTGIELGMGHWAYSLLTESRNMTPSTAGIVVAGYWGAFTLARILAGFYAYRIQPALLTKVSLAGAGCMLWILAVNPHSIISAASVVLVGFAIGPVFPALISGTSQRVGLPHTTNTIGMQMAAGGLGAATLPSVGGWLGAQMGIGVISVYLAVLCMAVLVLMIYSGRHTSNV